MAKAWIYNGVMLPPLDRDGLADWAPPSYVTISHTPSRSNKYPYWIALTEDKPSLSRNDDGTLSLVCSSDNFYSSGDIPYTADFPSFIWDANEIARGGEIWRSGDERRLIWTNYDLYLDGELYLKATAPIEAAHNANDMSDSMRRFITQRIYDDIEEREAGALMSRYKQKPKTNFAVYSADDNSLTFYNNAAYESIKAAVDAGRATSYRGKTVTGLYTGFETAQYAAVADVPWVDVKPSITRVAFADVTRPLSTALWFVNCSALERADVRNLDTSRVTAMNNMFQNCSNLIGLNVSGFNTSNCTTMRYMFRGCSKITRFDLSNFNTSKVETFYGLFAFCSALTSVDLSSFDTSQATTFENMFTDCPALEQLDLSGFDTRNVEKMDGMFQNCTGLTSVDLSSFDTSNCASMSYMFKGCDALASVDLSSFDTNKVTNMHYMFYSCDALTTISVSDLWTNAAVTDSVGMFTDCVELVGGNGKTYLNSHTTATYACIDTADTPGYFTYKPGAFAVYSATDNSLTFYNSSRDYDTVAVGDTYEGKAVTNLYKGIATEEYTSSNLPWYDIVTDITSVVVADVIRPKSTKTWFFCFRNCISMDLNKLDTSKVTSMNNMFYCCNALPSVDLSKFDTSKVTITQNMFRECIALTSLDLSTWNTAALATTSFMFYGCTALETVYVSDLWTTAAVTTSNNMFKNCISLKGGNGTVFSSSYVDKTYARIDTASTPGYFTYKDPGAQPVAYRYNGVELADIETVLTDEQKAQYPYMDIYPSTDGGYYFECHPDARVKYGTFTLSGNTYTVVHFEVSAGEKYEYLSCKCTAGDPWGEITKKTIDRSGINGYTMGYTKGLVWANFDIPNLDTGDTYLAASAPVPVYECEPPVAYLCNDVRVPVFPKWNKVTYPYAYLNEDVSGAIEFICATKAFEHGTYTSGSSTLTNTHITVLAGTVEERIKYTLSGDAWGEPAAKTYDQSTSTSGRKLYFDNIFWTNTDIPNLDTGGVYLKASEPIRVYE